MSPSRGREVAFQRAGACVGKRSRADGGVHGASRAPGERGFCFKSKKKPSNDAVTASLVSPTRPSARQGWTPTRTCGCLSHSSRHHGLLTKHLPMAVSPAIEMAGAFTSCFPEACRTWRVLELHREQDVNFVPSSEVRLKSEARTSPIGPRVCWRNDEQRYISSLSKGSHLFLPVPFGFSGYCCRAGDGFASRLAVTSQRPQGPGCDALDRDQQPRRAGGHRESPPRWSPRPHFPHLHFRSLLLFPQKVL